MRANNLHTAQLIYRQMAEQETAEQLRAEQTPEPEQVAPQPEPQPEPQQSKGFFIRVFELIIIKFFRHEK